MKNAGLYGWKWSHRPEIWWQCSCSICTWNGPNLRQYVWGIFIYSGISHVNKNLNVCEMYRNYSYKKYSVKLKTFSFPFVFILLFIFFRKLRTTAKTITTIQVAINAIKLLRTLMPSVFFSFWALNANFFFLPGFYHVCEDISFRASVMYFVPFICRLLKI